MTSPNAAAIDAALARVHEKRVIQDLRLKLRWMEGEVKRRELLLAATNRQHRRERIVRAVFWALFGLLGALCVGIWGGLQ